MAPFCFIQCRAADVSSPPEKAMPTFWPTGSDSRITDIFQNLKESFRLGSQIGTSFEVPDITFKVVRNLLKDSGKNKFNVTKLCSVVYHYSVVVLNMVCDIASVLWSQRIERVTF